MGRKKKSAQTTVDNTQSIGYSGKISISIVNGKRVISKQNYHNEGRLELFRFLANCLAGNLVEGLRPIQIKFFKYPANTSFNWTEAVWNDTSTAPKAVSPFIIYDAMPIVKANETTNTCTVVFHFRVPLSYLTDDSNLIGLYSSNSSDDFNASAWVIPDQPITLPENVVNNYSLILEWTLSISNK